MMERSVTKGGRTQVYFKRFRLGEEPQGAHLLATSHVVRSIEVPRVSLEHHLHPLREAAVIPLYRNFMAMGPVLYESPELAICHAHALEHVPIGADAKLVAQYLDLVECALDPIPTGYEGMLASIQAFGQRHSLPVLPTFFDQRLMQCQREEARSLLIELHVNVLLYGRDINEPEFRQKWARIKALVPNVENDFELADLYDSILIALQEASGNWRSAFVNELLPSQLPAPIDTFQPVPSGPPVFDFLTSGQNRLFAFFWKHQNQYLTREKIAHDLKLSKPTSVGNFIQRLRVALKLHSTEWRITHANGLGDRLERKVKP